MFRLVHQIFLVCLVKSSFHVSKTAKTKIQHVTIVRASVNTQERAKERAKVEKSTKNQNTSARGKAREKVTMQVMENQRDTKRDPRGVAISGVQSTILNFMILVS